MNPVLTQGEPGAMGLPGLEGLPGAKVSCIDQRNISSTMTYPDHNMLSQYFTITTKHLKSLFLKCNLKIIKELLVNVKVS